MPARVPPRRTGSGFGGFGPVTTEVRGGYVRDSASSYPRQSDVDQASETLNFGGTPRPTQNVPVAIPPPVQIDPSWAGFASPGLGGNTLRSLPNDRFTGTANTETIPSSGGRSPFFTTDPNDDWMGTTYPMTGNAFDEIQGSVYDENPSRGGRSPSFTTNPDDDWTGGQPEGEPTVQTPRADATPASMDDEPVLFSDPNSQRPSVTIDTSGGRARGGMNQAGYDIANFGGNMTLGQFLSTPLAFMRFGENRGVSPEPVGRGRVLVGSENNYDMGASVDPTTGWSPSTEELANADATFAAAEEQGAVEGRAVSPEVRTALPAGQSQGPDLTAILQTYPSLNNPAAIRAINSGARPEQLMGHAQFDSHAGNLMLMESQAFGGAPNNPRGAPQEGRDRFDPRAGYVGKVNEDTGIIERKRTTPGDPKKAAEQKALYQAALRAVPMRGGFNAEYVQRLNDWIARQMAKKGG